MYIASLAFTREGGDAGENIVSAIYNLANMRRYSMFNHLEIVKFYGKLHWTCNAA